MLEKFRLVLAYILLFGLVSATVLLLSKYQSQNLWGTAGTFGGILGVFLLIWVCLGLGLTHKVWPPGAVTVDLTPNKLTVENRMMWILPVSFILLGFYGFCIFLDHSVGPLRLREGSPFPPLLGAFLIGFIVYECRLGLIIKSVLNIDERGVSLTRTANVKIKISLTDIKSVRIERNLIGKNIVIVGTCWHQAPRFFNRNELKFRKRSMMVISGIMFGGLRAEEIRDFIVRLQQESELHLSGENHDGGK